MHPTAATILAKAKPRTGQHGTEREHMWNCLGLSPGSSMLCRSTSAPSWMMQPSPIYTGTCVFVNCVRCSAYRRWGACKHRIKHRRRALQSETCGRAAYHAFLVHCAGAEDTALPNGDEITDVCTGREPGGVDGSGLDHRAVTNAGEPTDVHITLVPPDDSTIPKSQSQRKHAHLYRSGRWGGTWVRLCGVVHMTV